MGEKGNKGISKDIAERMILAKLYKDGLFQLDDEKRTATIECRKSVLEARYTEESYSDIKSILQRTALGLEEQGYEVTLRALEDA